MRSIRTLITIGSMATMLIPASAFAVSTPVSDAEMEAMQTQATANDGDFLQTFLSGTTATDSSLNAAFDIRAFRSHPCFSAVGEEQDYCLGLFGLTSDFESMVEGNEIGRLIVQHALNMRCKDLTAEEYTACTNRNAAVLPRLMEQVNIQVNTGSVMGKNENTDDETVGSDNDDDAVTLTMNRRMRSQHLWKLCEDHEETQAGCYQNFLRFVTDETVSEAEISKVFGVRD